MKKNLFFDKNFISPDKPHNTDKFFKVFKKCVSMNAVCLAESSIEMLVIHKVLREKNWSLW